MRSIHGRGSAVGSQEKAERFLEVSDSHKHYSSIVEYTLAYFITKAEKEGMKQFAADLKKAREDYKQEFDQAIEITQEVYREIFSDAEMDDLIILHSNPAIQKLRGLTSEIMNKVLEKYSRVAS
jgi:hypothetical protein